MEKTDLNNRKNSTYIVLAVAIAFVGILIYQQLANRNPNEYISAITKQREQKDNQFKNASSSPIKEEERKEFEGLKYFTPNPAYKAYAKLQPGDQADTLILMTTQGSDYKVILAGQLGFKLQGRSHKLTAYRYLDPSRQKELFVPFRDMSTSVSTYGGGRYLDLRQVMGQDIEIDFNKAYNPYCVYNESYLCPLPPTENKIMLEILAGEKMYP